MRCDYGYYGARASRQNRLAGLSRLSPVPSIDWVRAWVSTTLRSTRTHRCEGRPLGFFMSGENEPKRKGNLEAVELAFLRILGGKRQHDSKTAAGFQLLMRSFESYR